jgi:hypothetical protein
LARPTRREVRGDTNEWKEVTVSEQEQEVGNGEESIDEEDQPATTDDDGGWDETNDEPAQGEGGQEAV